MGLKGRAPIWRRVEQTWRAKWIRAQTVLRVGIERSVYGGFEIKRVIDECVRSHTGHMRCKRAVQDCGGAKTIAQCGHRVRKAPGLLRAWQVRLIDKAPQT